LQIAGAGFVVCKTGDIMTVPGLNPRSRIADP
jgi:formyltetrahydrofolate synthetase